MIKVYITRKYTTGTRRGLCYNDVVEFTDAATAMDWSAYVNGKESVIGNSIIVAAFVAA